MTKQYEIIPDKPLAASIEMATDAVLIPVFTNEARKGRMLGGVLRADGSYVQNSACYIDENRCPTRPPTQVVTDDCAVQPGRWLFGGRYDHRFGHFLVETVAPLWALDHIGARVDGIAFLPPFGERKVSDPDRAIAACMHLYRLFNDLPHPKIIVAPTHFETLYVPPQGCGAGALSFGCPEFRQFARARFTRKIRPVGGEKLYISRAQLLRTPGQIVHEALLEDAMRSEGYEIFCPEKHSIETQIARIRAAKMIVGVEGSAFHLVAYAGARNCKIGVIRRRDNQDGIVSHCRAFHGERTFDLRSVMRGFVIPGSRHQIGNAVLDFAVLADQLQDAGLVGSSFTLPALGEDDILRGIEELEGRVLGGKTE